MSPKTYTELMLIDTFLGRYKYLRLGGSVGNRSYSVLRETNQKFYSSHEWSIIRNRVITRDGGFDLALQGYILNRVVVHHIVPISSYDLVRRPEMVLGMDNLISVSPDTHRAIHYSDETLLPLLPTIRKKGDTNLW